MDKSVNGESSEEFLKKGKDMKRYHFVLIFLFLVSVNFCQNLSAFYHPEMGRFVSRDPIGYAGIDYNVYRYNGNISNRFVDPRGLSIESPTMRELDCIGDCTKGCSNEYNFFYPQRYICRSYCDNTCTNADDILDETYKWVCPKTRALLNNKTFNCGCAVMQVLDYVPVTGRNIAVNTTDFFCTLVSTANLFCEASENGRYTTAFRAGAMTFLTAVDALV